MWPLADKIDYLESFYVQNGEILVTVGAPYFVYTYFVMSPLIYAIFWILKYQNMGLPTVGIKIKKIEKIKKFSWNLFSTQLNL